MWRTRGARPAGGGARGRRGLRGGALGRRGPREVGSEGGLIAGLLAVELGTSCGVQAPGSGFHLQKIERL